MQSFAPEICVDTLDSVCAAYDAACFAENNVTHLRLELCSALHQGGLTPSIGFVRSVCEFLLASRSEDNDCGGRERSGPSVELFLMIRCRAGLDFVYSAAEMRTMLSDVAAFAEMAASHPAGKAFLRGVVFGALIRENRKFPSAKSAAPVIARAIGIDVDKVSAVAQLAAKIGNLSLTFHRAIDYCGADAKPLSLCETETQEMEDDGKESSALIFFAKALHQIRAAGAQFLLTSGGISHSAADAGALAFIEAVLKMNGAAAVESAPPLKIIIGGGVNANVIGKVQAMQPLQQQQLHQPQSPLAIISGVHFSAKRVIKGEPESESYWQLDKDLAQQMLSTCAAVTGETGICKSNL